MSKSKHQALFS